MAEAYKCLAQSSPAATTLTDLYTVPASTSAIISSITICNRSAASATFRISVAIAGAADAVAQYIYYDLVIQPKDTFVATIGLSLATTDKVRVYASAIDLNFHAYGVEIT